MALTKLKIAPGVNRELTRYGAQGQWWDSDHVRFRGGYVEKIGGYVPYIDTAIPGTARSLFSWVTLPGQRLLGLGTSQKYYLVVGTYVYDITPVQSSATRTNPFVASAGSATLTVTDAAHGRQTGDYVTFSGATGLGGNVTSGVLNAEYSVTATGVDTYTVQLPVTANATDAAGSPGGGTVLVERQVSIGAEIAVPVTGWGSGGWDMGTWGRGEPVVTPLRLWSQHSFGEDLVYCPRGQSVYYWSASAPSAYATRGVAIQNLVGSDSAPTAANAVLVSDASRFVLCFGATPYGSPTLDPLLVRWSDQESVLSWAPSATNQAGEIRLSSGSEIVTQIQTRQEILVWTDTALYSMQYSGPPAVWSTQIMSDSTTIMGPNAAAVANGKVYWMGVGKFHIYDGSVHTLECTLRSSIFSDFAQAQAAQVFAGTVNQFNEIWWFYPSSGSTIPDRYVVYNYQENIWYRGSMTRYAWLDSGLFDYPLATATGKLMQHEFGPDNVESGTPVAIHAFAETAVFDLVDGDHFGFSWRVLPDVTFRQSEAATPQVTMTFYPLKDAGSGLGESVGGDLAAGVTRAVAVPVEQFTGQAPIRMRGRHAVMRVESNQVGCQWQMGVPRLEVRPDGLRG